MSGERSPNPPEFCPSGGCQECSRECDIVGEPCHPTDAEDCDGCQHSEACRTFQKLQNELDNFCQNQEEGDAS